MPLAWAIGGSALLGTIGSIFSSSNASSAAQQAANVQAQAANQAAQYQFAQYNQTRNDLLPFQNVGRGAIQFINGLVPGGVTPSNPTLPGGQQQLAGYDASGNPVYVPAGGDQSGGATGGSVPQSGAMTNSGTNPYLAALYQNVPQLGVAAQNSLGSFLPGNTGGNPLQSSLYSFVPGASGAPNSALSAVNSAVLGGSGSPNAALNNLTSFIPGGQNANPTFNGLTTGLQGYGALLGLNASPMATGQLQQINDNYNAARNAWLAQNPGKTDADWAKTDQFSGYNDQLTKFYQNNPSLAASGFAQAQSQINDPNFGSAAASRIKALSNISPADAMQGALAQTPGYQFTLDQGLKAVQNSYAAQGLGSSGAAVKGAAQFATGLADQTYQQQLNNYLQNFNTNLNNYNSQANNAYNIYNGTSTNALNAYGQQSGLALNSYGQGFNNAFNAYGQQFNNSNTGYNSQFNNGYNLLTLGSNAGAQTGTIGAQTASNAGGYLTSGAAAQAGGIVGSANAINNGLLGGINNLSSGALAYGMFSGGGGTVGNLTVPGYYPSSGYGSGNPLTSFTPYTGG